MSDISVTTAKKRPFCNLYHSLVNSHLEPIFFKKRTSLTLSSSVLRKSYLYLAQLVDFRGSMAQKAHFLINAKCNIARLASY